MGSFCGKSSAMAKGNKIHKAASQFYFCSEASFLKCVLAKQVHVLRRKNTTGDFLELDFFPPDINSLLQRQHSEMEDHFSLCTLGLSVHNVL